MKFSVGDVVRVTNAGTTRAFDGTLPVGSVAKVRAVWPNECCGKNEVSLRETLSITS